MNTEEKELSPHESLALIQSMINRTKDSVADDSFYFLLWGWLVFACCIGEYILKVQLNYANHFIVWWSMPLAGIISGIYGARQAKQQRVRSFIDTAVGYLWLAVALAFFAVVLSNFFSPAVAWQNAFSQYILLYAIGTFVSGSLLRFRPLVIGGAINFALATVSSHFSYDYQLLIGALAILTSYIIPGHLLRIKYRKAKK